MSHILYYLQSTGAVVLTFAMVIFLHEAGHFFVCRWLGVRVEKFAFGFGPELLGVTGASGTRFSICALPLGGFVKPAGEEQESSTGKPDEYFGQSWNRRLAIVAAGPAMNYILAFVLFTGVILIKGMPEPGMAPIIGNMMVGYPADRAGIQVDDSITAINGKETKTWEEVANTIHQFPHKELELTYTHKGESHTVAITPTADEAGEGVIGIMAKPEYKAVGFGVAVKEGAAQCWRLTTYTVTAIATKLGHRERPDLAGPVGIVQMVSRAARSGWEDLVFFIGMISVAIGFFNVLPVPLLDGGHAAFYIWEGATGKPLSKDAVARLNTIGIALLMSLLVFATYNDVVRMRSERAAKAQRPDAVEPAHPAPGGTPEKPAPKPATP